MGTDIHLYVEKKSANGRWEEVAPPYTTDYGTKTWYLYNGTDDERNMPDPTERRYNLFALLADVRNGYGFAGVPTHEAVSPLFPYRGIPSDTSYEETDEYWLGDHSFTWATLNELLSVNWEYSFQQTGVVNAGEYMEFLESGIPSGWCGDVSGGGASIVDSDVFHKMILDGNDTDGFYTRVSFSYSPLASCGFVRWLNESLLPICNGKPENIRVLIGFDS